MAAAGAVHHGCVGYAWPGPEPFEPKKKDACPKCDGSGTLNHETGQYTICDCQKEGND